MKFAVLWITFRDSLEFSFFRLMEHRRLAYFRWRGCCFRFEVFRISSSGHLLDPGLSRKHWFPLLFPMQPPTDTAAGGVLPMNPTCWLSTTSHFATFFVIMWSIRNNNKFIHISFVNITIIILSNCKLNFCHVNMLLKTF